MPFFNAWAPAIFVDKSKMGKKEVNIKRNEIYYYCVNWNISLYYMPCNKNKIAICSIEHSK